MCLICGVIWNITTKLHPVNSFADTLLIHQMLNIVFSVIISSNTSYNNLLTLQNYFFDKNYTEFSILHNMSYFVVCDTVPGFVITNLRFKPI